MSPVEKALLDAKKLLEERGFYVSNEATSEKYQSFIVEVSLRKGKPQ